MQQERASLTFRFVAVGECMVEMAPTGEGTYALGFAGDTLNTAWYARKCLGPGAEVSYLTAVGTDRVSDRMIEFLQGSGIETGPVQRRADKTVGLYMIQLENGERSFAYWRSDSAARTLARDTDQVEVALRGASVVYLSGITLAILPPEDRRGVMRILQALRDNGTKVAFDPNLRPRLWPDMDTMRASVTEFVQYCDFVMPSFEDEEAHFGDPAPLAAAERYRAAGAGLVVVKNGPQDVLCLGKDGLKSFSPDPVRHVVDTTAAGDSFNAAFLASYLTGAHLEQAVMAGARLAAQVIQHRGALVPEAGPAEIGPA